MTHLLALPGRHPGGRALLDCAAPAARLTSIALFLLWPAFSPPARAQSVGASTSPALAELTEQPPAAAIREESVSNLAMARARQGPVAGQAEAPPPVTAPAAPPAPAPEEAGLPQLSPEELADLEHALAADAASAAATLGKGTSPARGGNRLGAALANFNPDLSAILDVAAGWFSGKGKAITAGSHDPQKTGFTFQQLELTVGQSVDPYFRLDANLVFSQFGVEVEEAYATTLALPLNLQVRAGQFLTRFGRLNATHPHTWEFIDQNFALTRVFGGEGNRGLGAELSWLAPLPWFAELMLSVTDAAGASTARSFLGGGEFDIASPLDFQVTAALKQFFPLTDALSLNVGLSAATGPNPTGNDNRTDIYGLDLYLRWRPVHCAALRWIALQAELFWRRRQIPDDLLQDLNAYAQIAWRFGDRWSVAARYEWGSPSWDLGGSPSARDWLDSAWTRERHRVSAAVTFHPSEFSRLRLQGARDRAPSLAADPIWSAFLAAEFFVGAHAAHAF